ncbi:MAG: hypothetical protein WA459_15680 [Stellaceae bacterium]
MFFPHPARIWPSFVIPIRPRSISTRRGLEFADAIARARHLSAHALAEDAVAIADSVMEIPKDDLTAALVHAIRNRCDQRRWLAGQFNPAYASKTAITDADGGSLIDRHKSKVERLKKKAVEQGLLDG